MGWGRSNNPPGASTEEPRDSVTVTGRRGKSQLTSRHGESDRAFRQRVQEAREYLNRPQHY